MTHFIGAVVVPGYIKLGIATSPTNFPDLYGKDALETAPGTDLKDYLDKALAKFDENVEVERWVSKADTIAEGRAEIQKYAEGTYAEYLADPEAYSKGVSNLQHLDYLANEFPKRLAWTDEEVYAHEIKFAEPEDIREDGAVRHTYNPNSKWDWWTIGGRWEKTYRERQGETVETVLERARQTLSDITDPANVAELTAYKAYLDELATKRNEQGDRTREWYAANPDQRTQDWRENWRLANAGEEIVDLDTYDEASGKLIEMKGYLPWWFPFHIVVPTQVQVTGEAGELIFDENNEPVMERDFSWEQQGKVGWFGMKSNEMNESTWVRRFIELLEKQDPKDRLVYIDFHI